MSALFYVGLRPVEPDEPIVVIVVRAEEGYPLNLFNVQIVRAKSIDEAACLYIDQLTGKPKSN